MQALNAVAANVSFVEIESDKGHDAFLLEEPEFFATVRGFLDSTARKAGMPPATAPGRTPDASVQAAELAPLVAKD